MTCKRCGKNDNGNLVYIQIRSEDGMSYEGETFYFCDRCYKKLIKQFVIQPERLNPEDSKIKSGN